MLFQNIEKVTWDEIKDRAELVNPKVSQAISAIPSQEHPALYLASYPFGELILEQGLFHLPYQKRFVPTDDPSLPSELAHDLNYGPMPMIMTLNKSSEIFLALHDRTYPLHFMKTGQLFGLWSLLDTNEFASSYHRGMWSIAAGARTIFLVPKVMDYGSHSRMQRQLQLSEAYPPHTLFNQGPVFADIARAETMNCSWQSQILIFGRGWADALNAKKWPDLYHLLLQREWDDTLFLRNHLSIEIVWQVLAQAQAHTRLKPNVYVIDTVKHLMNIAINTLPGFVPLSQDYDHIAPIQVIQNAYLDYYGLKQYIPTLMAPGYVKDHPAVYYSFLYPSLLSLSPNHNFRNTLEDERNIKSILELFKSELASYPDYQRILAQDILFEFFHFEADSIYGIHPSLSLEKVDPAFMTFPQDPERIFSDNGPFIRSCVRLSQPSRIR